VRTEGPGPFEFILGEQWPVEWLFEKPLDTKKLLAKIEAIFKAKKIVPSKLTAAGNNFFNEIFHPDPLPRRRREGDGCRCA